MEGLHYALYRRKGTVREGARVMIRGAATRVLRTLSCLLSLPCRLPPARRLCLNFAALRSRQRKRCAPAAPTPRGLAPPAADAMRALGEQERELDARKASLGKWKLELIHRLMDALDMTRGSGDKARAHAAAA